MTEHKHVDQGTAAHSDIVEIGHERREAVLVGEVVKARIFADTRCCVLAVAQLYDDRLDEYTVQLFEPLDDSHVGVVAAGGGLVWAVPAADVEIAEWIDCEDTTPEIGQRVITRNRHGEIVLATVQQTSVDIFHADNDADFASEWIPVHHGPAAVPAQGGTAETPTAELIARAFHETYERLAPEHGYKTRRASAVPWDQVPGQNRALMTAVCMDLLASRVIADSAVPAQDGQDAVEIVDLLGTIRDRWRRYTRHEYHDIARLARDVPALLSHIDGERAAFTAENRALRQQLGDTERQISQLTAERDALRDDHDA